jgi:hypothetical protein
MTVARTRPATAHPVDPHVPPAPSIDDYGEVPILGPLLDAVPEFVPAFMELCAGCGDEPGEPSVLMELAEFVTDHLDSVRRRPPLVERVLGVVEAHLESMAGDHDRCDVVAFAFFDTLDPAVRGELAAIAGPLSRRAVEELDAPTMPDRL